MMYIPDEWIKDKGNEVEIRKILADITGCIKTFDYNDKLNQDKKRLKEMGEDIILEKLGDGAFKI